MRIRSNVLTKQTTPRESAYICFNCRSQLQAERSQSSNTLKYGFKAVSTCSIRREPRAVCSTISSRSNRRSSRNVVNDAERTLSANPGRTNRTYNQYARQLLSATPSPSYTWNDVTTKTSSLLRHPTRRQIHHSAQSRLETTTVETNSIDPYTQFAARSVTEPSSIRRRLRKWEMEYEANKKSGTLTKSDSLENKPDPEFYQELFSNKDAKEEVAVEDEEEDQDYMSLEEYNATWTRFLRPGDLAVFSRGQSQLIMGICLGMSGADVHLYTITGIFTVMSRILLRYQIPGFLNQQDLQSILDHAPTEQAFLDMAQDQDDASRQIHKLPAELAKHVLAKIRDFQHQTLEVYRKNSTRLDQAHKELADRQELRLTLLKVVASRLLGVERDKLRDCELFAVFVALSRAKYRYLIYPKAFIASGLLAILPVEAVHDIERTISWIRQWQEHNASRRDFTGKMDSSRATESREGVMIINGFLEKARRIVHHSRKTRTLSPDGTNLSPSKIQRPLSPNSPSTKVIERTEEPFTAQEQSLINMLQSLCLTRTLNQVTAYNALASLLLKATGLYEGFILDSSIARTFLSELGVVHPYMHSGHYDSILLLPGNNRNLGVNKLAAANSSSTFDTSKFKDSMARLRHDFGDLPVYCIDSETTKDVDDGISIEPAAKGNGWWIHIHIANPTAFMSPTNPVARVALHQTETIYFADRYYGMLPSNLVQSMWSLAPNRPSLTFSARLNKDGSVAERVVRSGLVRNVIRLTPSEVDKILNANDSESKGSDRIVVVAGGPVPPIPDRPEVQERTRDPHRTAADLNALSDLAQLRLAFRLANGGIQAGANKVNVSVFNTWNKSGLNAEDLCTTHARIIEGDPVIRVSSRPWVNMFKNSDGKADMLVSECMLLCSEVAGSWCHERQIPIIHRGTLTTKQSAKTAEHYWNTTCAPAAKMNGGVVPEHLGVEYIRSFGQTTASINPLKHAPLGLNNYTKVTSPLRRYGDMLTHWQIEGALREEANTGKSLITTDVNAPRKFLTNFNMDGYISELVFREKYIGTTKSWSERWWLTQLVARAHTFGEFKLPFDVTRVVISYKPALAADTCKGVIIDTGYIVDFQETAENPNRLQSGDIWEAVIDTVQPVIGRIWMKPLRLIYRWE